jgi:hypothetical protein
MDICQHADPMILAASQHLPLSYLALPQDQQVHFLAHQVEFTKICMVLAPVFERQNISLVTEQRLRSALTSFGL